MKTRTVFAGYLDDPEQTAEVLKDGWLKTGDLGFLDPSGHLHLVGRTKNMIVTAGGTALSSVDDLGDGLARLAADPAGTRAMGESGREVAVAQYSWDSVARRYAELFTEGKE